jgi:hypothetical protein
MKQLQKLVAVLAAAALVALPLNHTEGATYSVDDQGQGYYQAVSSSSVAPAIALGTIAIVAIVAVAVSNQSHGHGHSH